MPECFRARLRRGLLPAVLTVLVGATACLDRQLATEGIVTGAGGLATTAGRR